MKYRQARQLLQVSHIINTSSTIKKVVQAFACGLSYQVVGTCDIYVWELTLPQNWCPSICAISASVTTSTRSLRGKPSGWHTSKNLLIALSIASRAPSTSGFRRRSDTSRHPPLTHTSVARRENIHCGKIMSNACWIPCIRKWAFEWAGYIWQPDRNVRDSKLKAQ